MHIFPEVQHVKLCILFQLKAYNVHKVEGSSEDVRERETSKFLQIWIMWSVVHKSVHNFLWDVRPYYKGIIIIMAWPRRRRFGKGLEHYQVPDVLYSISVQLLTSVSSYICSINLLNNITLPFNLLLFLFNPASR